MRHAARRALAALVLAAAPLAASAAPADLEEVARRVHDATNEFRASQGRPALARDAKLHDAAREFARYMARTGRYGHTADGREPAERVRAHGYDYCMVLENIAYQYSSADFESAELARRLVEGWKASPGHRRNMLERDATAGAVAVARSGREPRYYAVHVFARPASAALRFQVRNESGERVRYRVGARDFALAPRVVRTHELCGPGELAFELGGERKAPPRFRPRDGDRFVVAQRRGSVSVTRE